MKWRYLLYILILVAVTIWFAVFLFPSKELKIITCDVGQGDANLIIYGNSQILIDGGPDNSVIGCLSRYLPFWDRTIEVVMLTHPQKDHFMGLIDVFRRYKVKIFLANSLNSSDQEYGVLKSQVGGSGARIINPVNGQSIRLGLIQLDIFHPSNKFFVENTKELKNIKTEKPISEVEDVLGVSVSELDPNEFSIVTQLSYKDFNALFTGDISPEVSDLVVQELIRNDRRPIKYIKIPHHGSKNGLTDKLLRTVEPKVAVISVGTNNPYGHPHEEVIKMLEEYNVTILRTDEKGNIVVESNGKDWWIGK